MKKTILLAASLATAALGVQGLAQEPITQDTVKAERPTEIRSVRLNVQNDGDNAYFLFSEDVVLSATNMLVECDTLEVFATRQAEDQEDIGKYGAIQRIVASGDVRIVQEERIATCERAVVQPNEERIVLTGSPVVEQAGGRLVTTSPQDEIILDRGNGRITVNSTGPNRIRLIGPAIGDLGFEQDTAVPTPDVINEIETGEGADELAEEGDAETPIGAPIQNGDDEAPNEQEETDAE